MKKSFLLLSPYNNALSRANSIQLPPIFTQPGWIHTPRVEEKPIDVHFSGERESSNFFPPPFSPSSRDTYTTRSRPRAFQTERSKTPGHDTGVSGQLLPRETFLFSSPCVTTPLDPIVTVSHLDWRNFSGTSGTITRPIFAARTFYISPRKCPTLARRSADGEMTIFKVPTPSNANKHKGHGPLWHGK